MVRLEAMLPKLALRTAKSISNSTMVRLEELRNLQRIKNWDNCIFNFHYGTIEELHYRCVGGGKTNFNSTMNFFD